MLYITKNNIQIVSVKFGVFFGKVVLGFIADRVSAMSACIFYKMEITKFGWYLVTSWYVIYLDRMWHNFAKNRTRPWTHKIHPISRLDRRAMGCPLLAFAVKPMCDNGCARQSVVSVHNFTMSIFASQASVSVTCWRHQMETYWQFMRRINRSPVKSPHKGQWRGALMFSLICVWISGWVNNGEAGDLRRYRAIYDVNVMICYHHCSLNNE